MEQDALGEANMSSASPEVHIFFVELIGSLLLSQ